MNELVILTNSFSNRNTRENNFLKIQKYIDKKTIFEKIAKQLHTCTQVTIYATIDDFLGYPDIPSVILNIPRIQVILDVKSSTEINYVSVTKVLNNLERFNATSLLILVNTMDRFSLEIWNEFQKLVKKEKLTTSIALLQNTETLPDNLKEFISLTQNHYIQNISFISLGHLLYLNDEIVSKYKLRLSRNDFFGYRKTTHYENNKHGIRLDSWINDQFTSWKIKEEDFLSILTVFTYHETQSTSINVLPTNICNASCPYCVSSKLGFKNIRSVGMNYEKLDVAVEFVKRRGCDLANISGGGEPTLSPDVVKITHLLSQNFSQVILHTNGSLLLSPVQQTNKTLLEVLAQKGLTTISLHRVAISDDENFAGMRLSNRYNIQDVTTLARNLNINIQISCLLQKKHIRNLDDLQAFLEWAVSNRINRVVFREMLENLPSPKNTWEASESNTINSQVVSVDLVDELCKQRNQLVFTKDEPWGPNGYERFYTYHSKNGTPIVVKILRGKWYSDSQLSSQLSGFVFRTFGKEWNLYSGWVTTTDSFF